MNLLKSLPYLVFSLVLINFGFTHTANAAPKPAKVVLLLHGLAADMGTWNKLVNNSAGFDGHCANTGDVKFAKLKLTRNTEGVYCMRLNFGGLDRIPSAPKGLDAATCNSSGGCSGDYSTFDTLGREISIAIRRIKNRLGANTQIVLLGHSRGGLAARAFLQSTYPVKRNVAGFISTGTPHAGSPLGRYYAYMRNNCLPESKYDSIFDFGHCAQDWRFTNTVVDEIGGLYLKTPSVNFLSDASASIKLMNVHINKLPAIKFTQLSYNNTQFGCLGGDIFNPDRGCGYNIFSTFGKPSSQGLNAVLNGRQRSALIGDGIVPIASQKMTSIKGWKYPIKSYARANRIHTSEPDQTLDLSRALTNMYKRLGWIA